MPVVNVKQVLANERTYLEWMNMAVTIGGIAGGLLGFSVGGSSRETTTEKHENAEQVAQYIGLLLLPVSIVFAVYACWLYYYRNKQIHQQATTNLQVVNSPVVLGIILLFSLIGILLIDLTVSDRALYI
mmetsp:Transcript_14397/g.17793  ORF Transcript_14397/g.17793 Transcript_14397/m.17793 type:complete len:129 (-) Transcript_14397:1345-1731(-)